MRSTGNRTNGSNLRRFALLAMFSVAAPGCSICCQPHLEDYVAFGSRTPRTNMKYGRVGSPFSDPNFGAVNGQPAMVNENGAPIYQGEEYYEGAVIEDSQEVYYEGE